jgi:hypothetical protein
MVLTTRRVAARERKLASLGTELTNWRSASADQNQPLRLHHSQIGRITDVLCALRSNVANPGAAAGSAKTLTDREVEATALELHRMWEFFRSKFAMRTVTWLRDYLDAVDDFAWSCYKPAREAARAAGNLAETALKEPPLLFFGGGWSPFAMPRDYAFDAETVPGEPIRNQAFKAALKKLPVPVIGIPWFQVEHLPDAVVIGHEVGHLVEDDLGLSTAIQDLVGGAAADDRRAAWRSWAGEIFGDFYGQLAIGPAFVGALAEVLADEPARVTTEKVTAPWDAYPTSYLRMKLNFQMLRALKFTTDADALEAEWKAVYGPTHNMSDYDADVDPIATAFVATTFQVFGDKPFTEVLSFAPLQTACDAAVSRLERKADPEPGEVRMLVAAARLFFAKSPSAYDKAAQDRVLRTIKLSLPRGVRGTRAISNDQKTADATLTDQLIALLAGKESANGETQGV